MFPQKLFVALLLLLLTDGIANAQPVTNLDPLTVTSARWPVKASENGRQIITLSAAQIAAMPGNTIEDVLRVSGLVELQQRGPAGAVNNVIIRGGTFQQVLVLIDGVRINDPVTGHFSANFPVPRWQIERIEILKGPAAAMYGSEAVGGVIHIITKAFQPADTSTRSNGYAYLSGGDHQFFAAEAGYRLIRKGVQYTLGASTDNTRGETLRSGNTGYVHRHAASAAVQIPLAKAGTLNFMSVYDYRDFGAQNFYTTFLSDTARENVHTWWNHLQWSLKKRNTETQVNLTYKNTRDLYTFNPQSVTNDNQSNAWIFQALQHRSIHPTLRLTYGVHSELRGIRSNDRGNHQTHRGDVFASLFWHTGNLRVHPGVRMVHDESFGTEWLPQLSINYRLKPFVLKAFAGRAIRAADFTERYNNYNKPVVSSGSIGNPFLEAERSWSYEGSIEWQHRNMVMGATYFIRSQNNVIDWVTTPYDQMPRKDNLVPGSTYALARNIESIETRGIELNFNWQKQLNTHWWMHLQFSSGWISSKSNAPTPSYYILSHAKQLHQQSITLQYKKWMLSATGIYKKRNRREANAIEATITPEYFNLNLRASYSLKAFNLFVNILNAGDERYADLLGADMPGRWITTGISKHFTGKRK
ncbi:MAG: TonB-dependent receptor [Ferruginibacter sp.]|nr:TonB-dependent receptor [Ferruginibacter sp.]